MVLLLGKGEGVSDPKEDKWDTSPWDDEAQTDVHPISIVVPEKEKRPPILRQVGGPGAPRDFPCVGERLVIGRGERVDFVVNSPELSREHALLQSHNGEYSCTDMDSRNGMYLNGIKIHSCSLRPGDTIQIGNISFLFIAE